MAEDYFLKTLHDTVGPIAYGITAAAIAAGTAWLNERNKARKHDLFKGVQFDARINELLAELRVQTGAMRAYLSKYHNGSEYLDDAAIMRKTRTHEVVRFGTSYQQGFFTDVPVSAFPSEMSLVLDEGHSYTKVADLPEDRFKNQCVAGGVQAVARCAIMKSSKPVGFLGLDFDLPEAPSEEKLLLICEYCSKIEALQAEERKS